MVDDASHIGGLLYIWSVTDVYYGGKLLAHQELTHGGLLQYLCSDKLLSQNLLCYVFTVICLQICSYQILKVVIATEQRKNKLT